MQEKRPSFWLRIAYLVGLALFFFASYNYANYYASLQKGVPSWVYGWEHCIPLLPWTILPYWSIDFFYGVSLLLPTTWLALNRHALRLCSVQLISITCFLAYPLRFSFDRPAVSGFFGDLFTILMGFDKPFNQAPSLHISLVVVLWVIYYAATKGVLRWFVNFWALLISISVLTTWQHHLVDVPTGAIVGLFCVWAWPLEGPSPLSHLSFSKDKKRKQIGVFYFAGFLFLAVLNVVWGWQAWPLGWGALALVIVAWGYFSVGVIVFQKQGPEISFPVFLLLSPYFLGAWLNSRIWTRKELQAVLVAPNVYLGRLPLPTDKSLRSWGAIVDLAAELPCQKGHAHYFGFPVLDLIVPSVETISQAVDRIEEESKKHEVLICCALGYSRSATVLAAYLMKSGFTFTIDSAVEMIRHLQPHIRLSTEHLGVLQEYLIIQEKKSFDKGYRRI